MNAAMMRAIIIKKLKNLYMYMKIFAKGSTYVFKTCDKVIVFFMLINLNLFIFYIEKNSKIWSQWWRR